MNNRYQKLEDFLKEVARLTVQHQVVTIVANQRNEEIAHVSPADLGKALEKVDPDWWKNI